MKNFILFLVVYLFKGIELIVKYKKIYGIQ